MATKKTFSIISCPKIMIANYCDTVRILFSAQCCKICNITTAMSLYVLKIFGVLQMQIWDTAGQERFRTITQNYYRSAHGAMIAYDLTRRSTFDSLPHWIHTVEQYGVANVVFVLVGMS